jgi:hypothetical protein
MENIMKSTQAMITKLRSIERPTIVNGFPGFWPIYNSVLPSLSNTRRFFSLRVRMPARYLESILA